MDGNKSKNVCPICSRKLNFLNKSLKINGQWICNECATPVRAILGNKMSYKDVSIEKLKKDIKTYNDAKMKEALSAPKTYGSTDGSESKAPKKACCPKCGSQNITPMGHKRKNISVGKAVGGAALFGGVGLAAGFLGKTDKKVEFYCSDCGHTFRR